MSIAALAHLSQKRPLVVACPTGSMAGQMYDDLQQFVGPDEVALFPAWETLPFERVSPAVETMGQRLELLWRLRSGERCPKVIVAGVRALLQKLGPEAIDVEPITIRPGAVVDPDAIAAQLVEFGYRREEIVEHRGEFARRGSIVDVYPSTADALIRIDLWGDEVDRLTTFGVNDQRSTADLDSALIFPARELIPTDEVRERAAGLVGSEPWGREQWERLAEGAHFDGMESWLPWLVDDDVMLTDVLPDTAKVVLIEPPYARPPPICSPKRTTSLARWRAPGHAIPTRSSPGSTPTPMRCSPASDRSGPSTPPPNHPTPRWWRRPVGARSAATAAVSPTD
ncbi:MAG: hypothetical protein R2697_09045 [Ilumatobacteraceae bacterium]